MKIVAMMLVMLLSISILPAKAATTQEEVSIQDINYVKGKIEIEFSDFVDFKPDFSIVIKDENNNSYTPVHYIKGDSDLDIYVNNLPEKQKITVTVIGVKYFDEIEYTTATGSFKLDNHDILIEKIVSDGKGIVDVTFKSKVKWRKSKVQVVDQNKKEYNATLKGKDSKECTISVMDIKEDMTYTFVISGIRTKGSKEYTSVTGTFVIAKTQTNPGTINTSSVKIEEIEFDLDDGELEIEFRGKVSWENPTVVITDKNGKVYASELTDYDKEECSISIEDLDEDETYFYKITGIKSSKESQYGTISGQFKATDD